MHPNMLVPLMKGGTMNNIILSISNIHKKEGVINPKQQWERQPTIELFSQSWFATMMVTQLLLSLLS